MSRTKAFGSGSWLPWDVMLQVVKLRLRPASRWQVYLVILLTSCRYGSRDAILTTADLALRTGLSERTVKDAIRDLVAKKLVRRTSRYRKLRPTILGNEPVEVELTPP